MIRILYDISYLVNHQHHRAGIVVVAENLLAELSCHPDVSLTLFSSTNSYILYSKYIANNTDCDFVKSQNWFFQIYNYMLLFLDMVGKLSHRYIPKIITRISNRLKIILQECVSYIYKVPLDQPYDIVFSPYNIIKHESMFRNKGIVVCNFIHDLIPFVLPEYKKGAGYIRFAKMMEHVSGHIFTISESSKKDILTYLDVISEKDITVVPLAASEQFCAKDQEESCAVRNQVFSKYNMQHVDKYILSVNTIESRKNIVHAVKSFVAMIDQYNLEDLYFVAVGKEIPGNDIYQYVDSCYHPYIITTGFVDDQDIVVLYQNALCFVYMSLYEGFGLPVLEAMCSGLPVIASNATSLPEVMGDAGISIDPYDSSELIASYFRMYDDRAFRDEQALKSLNRSKDFNWNRTADIIVKKMMKLVEG